MPPRDRTRRRLAPRQDRARASMEAIVTAAAQLLREHGFARLTTNRIASRAGVNVALVYRYFAGKEAIVGALIERTAEETHDAVAATLEVHARAPLAVAVRALLETLVSTPSAPALHRELVEHVEVTRRRALIDDLRARLAVRFAAFLEARRGELRPLADPEATRFILQHAIEGASNAAAFYRPASLSLERALDALTELVVGALGKRRPPRRRQS